MRDADEHTWKCRVSLEQVKGALVSSVGTAQTMVVAVIAIIAVDRVINAILMSVYERIGEIGIMKAVGGDVAPDLQAGLAGDAFICSAGAPIGRLLAVTRPRTDAALRHLLNIGACVRQDHARWSGPRSWAPLCFGLLAGVRPARRAAGRCIRSRPSAQTNRRT